MNRSYQIKCKYMAYSLILGNLVIDHLFAGINFDARDIFCIEILPHMVSTKFVYSLPKWIKQVLLYYSPYRGDPHIGKFVPDFVISSWKHIGHNLCLHFVRMADAKLYPMPRMCVRPRTLRSPGMSFPTILTICLYS